MREADIVLMTLPQADGGTKSRPTLILRLIPPFQDALVCGISSQLRQEVVGFDEVVSVEDSDFATRGLRVASVIRLGFLAVVPRRNMLGILGTVAPGRPQRLLQMLSDFLRP